MVDASITVVDRGHFKCDLNFLIEGETLGTRTNQNPDISFERNKVYNLVIQHPEGTILWDTGIHHDAADGRWPQGMYDAYVADVAHEHRLDDDLDRAGFDLQEIDYVIQSHLHSDHTGGLEFFEGTDVPIIVHEDELKTAYYSGKTEYGLNGYLPADFDRDLNWEAHRGDRTQYFEGIELVTLPGHTPGLQATVVHLDDHGTVIFASDEVYRRENFEDEIPLGAGLLWSKPHWLDSLDTLKDLQRRHDATVVFGHDTEQYREIEGGWA